MSLSSINVPLFIAMLNLPEGKLQIPKFWDQDSHLPNSSGRGHGESPISPNLELIEWFFPPKLAMATRVEKHPPTSNSIPIDWMFPLSK